MGYEVSPEDHAVAINDHRANLRAHRPGVVELESAPDDVVTVEPGTAQYVRLSGGGNESRDATPCTVDIVMPDGGGGRGRAAEGVEFAIERPVDAHVAGERDRKLHTVVAIGKHPARAGELGGFLRGIRTRQRYAVRDTF